MTKQLLFLSIFLITLFSFSQDVNIEVFATGFSSPVHIANAGDDRLFIVEQAGRIKVVNANGTTNATNFLNITSLISSGGERGLLSMAFDPDYTTNGFFYVNYTNNSGDTVIARYTVSADPEVADVNSGQILLTIDQPFSNHNGGCIAFGQDGYLYIGMGDGGSGGDPQNHAQNGNSLLGKILRIEVGADNTYSIPVDNPFVGDSTVLDEVWALGVRNPWKFSFDSLNGDLWMGDVGQNDFEEVNHTLNGVGGLNFGWRCYEGNATFNTGGCQAPSNYVFPVLDYPTGGFASVIGGYVYRGSEFPDLVGLYFFTDINFTEIRTIDPNNGYQVAVNEVGISFTVAFGEDVNNELYLANSNGSVYKIIDETASVNDNIITNDITINPNPARGSVMIKSESENYEITNIQVLNIIGSKVLNVAVNNTTNHRLNIENLKQGIYLLKIEINNNKPVIKKLVIK